MLSFLRLLLLITLSLLAGPIQTAEAFDPDCSTPLNATKTLLKNIMDNNSSAAATCIRSNEKTALQLKQVLDARGIFIDYGKIPSESEYLNETGLPLANIDPRLPEIQFEKVTEGPLAGQWQLSEHSIQVAHELYSTTFSSYVRTFLSVLPAPFFKSLLGFHIWQYLLFALILLVSWLAGRLVDRVIYNRILAFMEKQTFSLSPDKLLPLRTPIVWLTIALLFMGGLPDLQLPVRFSEFLFLIARFLLSISAVVLCSRVIDLLSEIFLGRAAQTESKLDDQLIPLVKRASKTLVWLLGILFILQNMGVEVTALVAFGSVGGVAIALASKDTVENLFGSLVIFIDQPFQVGEYVIIDGSIEGTIEEVGFRSTRIRTLDKTLISVPNGRIAHCTVNNFAKIPERRFKIILAVRYDTTPTQMEDFIASLRTYLSEHPMINPDTVAVYFTDMNSFSLDVLVSAFIRSNAMLDLHKFKHEAFLSFMKIAESHGVGFAFPTTTIELEDQHKPAKP